MKYETLIRILFDLLNYKKISTTDIAKKYGLSKRTIFRYIDCMSLAGIPISTEKGRYGGIYIMESFKLSSTFLSKEEFDSILSVLTAVNKEIPNKNIENAIKKLGSALRTENNSLTLSSGNLIIDAGPWGDAEGYKGKLQVIEKCIENSLLLKICYHDREGETTIRTIEPHKIIFKQGLWYVYSFCRLRNDFRLFKTGRIEYASPLDEHFLPRKIENENHIFDNWYNSLNCIMVNFEVDKKIASDIEEWLGIENVFYEKDTIKATAKLPDDKSLIAKILSYGTGLKVLSPESIKNKIKQSAISLVNFYN